MKKNIHIIISLLLFGLSSCSRSGPAIKQGDLPESCAGLVQLIKKNWKKNKESDYYNYDEVFLNKIQKEYRSCIVGLTIEEVIQLFGDTPVKLFDSSFPIWGKDFLLYYLDPGCSGYPENCRVLSFDFKDGAVKDFYVHYFEFVE